MDAVTFPVVERFVSVNGEGLRAGRLAAFIRMAGCNLTCAWCDTSWANETACPRSDLNADQLVEWVSATCVSCVTLTGGEPALQPGLAQLIEALYTSDAWGNGDERIIEIETNGSVDLSHLRDLRVRLEREHASSARSCPKTVVAFTVDCKLPSSGMASEMDAANYALLSHNDAVKFVVASQTDLEAASEVVREHDLCATTNVFFSPVFSCIEPADIVHFMETHDLSQVRLQLQMHKIIWPNVEKGV